MVERTRLLELDRSFELEGSTSLQVDRSSLVVGYVVLFLNVQLGRIVEEKDQTLRCFICRQISYIIEMRTGTNMDSTKVGS